MPGKYFFALRNTVGMIRLWYYLCRYSLTWLCNRLYRFFFKKLCRQFPRFIQYFRNQQCQYRNSSHNNTFQTFWLAARYINGFSDAVSNMFFLYLLYLSFRNTADNRPVYFAIPTHTHFVISLYLFRFWVVFPDLPGGRIQSAAVENMKFFFIIFYKKIDKVSIEMLYFVNKIFLLEQLILGGKKLCS